MLEYLHSSSRTSAGGLNGGLYSALVDQADSEESASRAVSGLLSCHVTQPLPWRLSAVSGLSIS